MVSASSDRDDIAQVKRNIYLAIAVTPPSNGPPIGAQRNTMGIAVSNGDGVAGARGDIRHAIIKSPGDNFAVCFEGETVQAAASNCDDIGKARGHIGLEAFL